MVEEIFWTTKQVAEALGVSPSTLRNWINKARKLPEPEWGRKGTRVERHYSRQWIEDAGKTLKISVDWTKLE
jgi:transposase-like protein